MTVFLAQSSSGYTGQYLIPLILTWTFTCIPHITVGVSVAMCDGHWSGGYYFDIVTFQGSSPTVSGVGGIASALTANAVGLLPRF